MDALNNRITGLENREVVDPVDFDALSNRVTKIVEKVGTLENVDIKALKDAIEEISQNIENLADDNSDIHRKINPLLDLPKKLKELENKIKAVGVSPQAIKDLLIDIERLKDRIAKLERQKTPTPPPVSPPPTPPVSPDTGGKPGNEGVTEGPEEILGTRAELVANRIYSTLRSKMPKNWKFTPQPHHAKCWKYYNVRPGTNVEKAERGKTETKYCLYDAQKDQYFYTDKWINFLLEKLQDPVEYQKIMKFKPTKE